MQDEDHPRVCGEELLNHSDPLITRGSPPRMRGRETFCKLFQRDFGITPAYAGKRDVLQAVPA